MSQSFGRKLVPLVAGFMVLALATAGASADDLVGKVKSVDSEAKKFVVIEKATDKETEVTIDSSTSWMKEKKAKVSKKFELAKLKVGANVEITREGSLASKVVIKEGKKKTAK